MVRTGLSFLIAASAALSAAPGARADTFTLDLTSTQYFDHAASSASGNVPATWNTGSANIEAPVAAGGTSGNEVDFGDGSDGEFLDGPAQTGITVSGSAITIDTDTKDTYNFIDFSLSAGKTITAIGSKNLVIHVLGTTAIAGQIALDGTAGTSNLVAGVSQPGPNPGGTAGAGGGRGGGGTSITSVLGSAAVNPSAPGKQTDIGIPGVSSSTTASYQGGGGGCLGQGPDAANDDGNGSGGAVTTNRGSCIDPNAPHAPYPRTSLANGFENSFFGGAGGGGGGAFTEVAAPHFSGGGGGGGGGALHLTSLNAVTFTGSITSKGGAGGSDDDQAAGDCGGGGGGGAGGAIWLQSASTIGGAGSSLDVSGGAGGISAVCGTTYAGGPGSRGAVRVDTASGNNAIATFTPASASLPDAKLALSAVSGETYVVYSKAIFLSHDIIAIGAPVVTQGCGSTGSLAVTYAGSNDGTTFGTEVTGDQISQLNDYPYVRFAARITTTGATPPCLTGLQLNWELRDLSSLELQGGLACATLRSIGSGRGGKGGPPTSPPGPGALGDLLCLAIALGSARLLKNTRVGEPVSQK